MIWKFVCAFIGCAYIVASMVLDHRKHEEDIRWAYLYGLLWMILGAVSR